MNEPINSYRDLRVWKEAMELAAQCYEVTRGFPRDEAYGMTAQIRRAAASVPANIAEGYGRGSTGQYVQFLRNAQGSLKEVETHLLLSVRVGILRQEDAAKPLECADSVGRMLLGLQRSIRPSEL